MGGLPGGGEGFPAEPDELDPFAQLNEIAEQTGKEHFSKEYFEKDGIIYSAKCTHDGTTEAEEPATYLKPEQIDAAKQALNGNTVEIELQMDSDDPTVEKWSVQVFSTSETGGFTIHSIEDPRPIKQEDEPEEEIDTGGSEEQADQDDNRPRSTLGTNENQPGGGGRAEPDEPGETSGKRNEHERRASERFEAERLAREAIAAAIPSAADEAKKHHVTSPILAKINDEKATEQSARPKIQAEVIKPAKANQRTTETQNDVSAMRETAPIDTSKAVERTPAPISNEPHVEAKQESEPNESATANPGDIDVHSSDLQLPIMPEIAVAQTAKIDSTSEDIKKIQLAKEGISVRSEHIDDRATDNARLDEQQQSSPALAVGVETHKDGIYASPPVDMVICEDTSLESEASSINEQATVATHAAIEQIYPAGVEISPTLDAVVEQLTVEPSHTEAAEETAFPVAGQFIDVRKSNKDESDGQPRMFYQRPKLEVQNESATLVVAVKDKIQQTKDIEAPKATSSKPVTPAQKEIEDAVKPVKTDQTPKKIVNTEHAIALQLEQVEHVRIEKQEPESRQTETKQAESIMQHEPTPVAAKIEVEVEPEDFSNEEAVELTTNPQPEIRRFSNIDNEINITLDGMRDAVEEQKRTPDANRNEQPSFTFDILRNQQSSDHETSLASTYNASGYLQNSSVHASNGDFIVHGSYKPREKRRQGRRARELEVIK